MSAPGPATFRADLDPRRPWGPWRVAGAAAAGVLLVLAAAILYVQLAWLSGLPKVPDAETLWSLNRPPGMTFYDRRGVRIATRGPRHGLKVKLSELPPYVPAAFLAAEDRRFWRHGPVDWTGVMRAAAANLKAGEVVQGGSTLTQQLAKGLFLGGRKTFRRKVQEAVLAGELEKRLGKAGVLELYLNRIFFGSEAWGLEAASETWFGKQAKGLTLQEAALLAALPRAPSRMAGAAGFEAALSRSRMILRRMAEDGSITQAQVEAAIAAPPTLAPPTPEDEDFGYVLDMAEAEAAARAGGKAPDLIVQLTIDSPLQVTASQIVRRVMQEKGRRAGAGQAALVALGPDGGVAAMAGGLDHRFSRFNRAVQAARQPGSAFKPLVYAAALEAGATPDEEVQDAPLSVEGWSPANYGGGYSGAVTVRQGLARSINTVAVRLARRAGTERIGDLALRFGMSSIPARPGLSVALGAYETSLMELTSAYQVFQQDGRRTPAHLVSLVATAERRVLWAWPGSQGQTVFDPQRAAVMTSMMQDVITQGTGTHAAIGRPAAGKTGTSQSWRDAWFVGFTPDWVCGVWVGNDDNRPMNKVTGGALPAEIWRRFMLAAHQDLPVRDFAYKPAPVAAAAGAEDEEPEQ